MSLVMLLFAASPAGSYKVFTGPALEAAGGRCLRMSHRAWWGTSPSELRISSET